MADLEMSEPLLQDEPADCDLVFGIPRYPEKWQNAEEEENVLDPSE